MFSENTRKESKGGNSKRRRRRGDRSNTGPGGNCLCPKCNHTEPHGAGQPCRAKKCPQCGSLMIREQAIN